MASLTPANAPSTRSPSSSPGGPGQAADAATTSSAARDAQAQDAGGVGSPVYEIADEHSLPAVEVGVHRTAEIVPYQGVAELDEQRLELGAAAVDVADHVERAVLVLVLIEDFLPDDDGRGRGHVLLGAQDVDLSESLLAEVLQGAPELIALALDHAITEVPVRPVGVAVQADPLGQVEHDRNRQHVVRAG